MLKYPVAALLVSGAAFGQDIKGMALALDDDTLLVTQESDGVAVTVKLWGIDAPDMMVWPWTRTGGPNRYIRPIRSIVGQRFG